MKRYIRCNDSYETIEKTAIDSFKSDNPGYGCSFIEPSGYFINIYPTLDVHEDLCEWIEDQLDLELKYKDEEYFVREYGWIRLRSDPNMAIIELPPNRPTSSQWYSLEDWLSFIEDRYNGKVRLYLDVCDKGPGSTPFELGTDGFTEDLLQILKRFYTSGKLYASTKTRRNKK